MAADGSIIVGSAGGNGGWVSSDQYWDLQRLAPTGKVPFEPLMIRSKGATSMEIEFTQPLAAASAAPGNFKVSQWNYTPTSAYGGPKTNSSTPSVTAAALSGDGKKVTLTLTGLKEKFVVSITMGNVKSAAGENLWTNIGYYTCNKFGPGTDHALGGAVPISARPEERARDWSVRTDGPGMLSVRAPGSGSFSFTLSDARGRTIARGADKAGQAGNPLGLSVGTGTGGGIFFWEGRGPTGIARGKLILP